MLHGGSYAIFISSQTTFTGILGHHHDDYSLFLYKLHGSLDWVQDKRLGIVSLEYPQAGDTEMIADDYDPLLILGQDKLKSVDPFLTFFYKLHRYLNNANVIVCIGYSFRDFHVNDVLLDALGNHNTTACLVVGPEGIKSLNKDQRFDRLINVENRFSEISEEAQAALQNDIIQKKIEELLDKAKGDTEIF